MLMKKLIRFIASPKLSLGLIIVMAVFLYLGSTGLFEDKTKQNLLSSRIFYSPVFLLVTVLFFVNISACTWRQLRSLLQQSGIAEFPLEIWASPVVSREEKEVLSTRITELLRNNGFKVSRDNGSDSFYARKGESGRWGAVVLHLGLLIITLGALIQVAFDFTGFLGMPEGTIFTDERKAYVTAREGILRSRDYGQFKLFLEQVKIKSKKDGAKAEGLLTLVKNGELVKKQWISQGHPLYNGLMNIYYNGMGYFVNVNFQAGPGKSENYSILLNTLKHSLSEDYSGAFAVPGKKYHISIKFIPDYVAEQNSGSGIPRTRSYEPKNPAFFIVITKADAGGVRQTLYRGTVPLGRQVTLVDGEKLTIDGVVPWITLYVKKEPGLYVIYAGLVIAIAGICLIYLIVCRTLAITTETRDTGCKLIIRGKRLKFTALNDSYNSLSARLNEMIACKKDTL